MVDTSDEWIRTRTGMRERRIAEPGAPTSDLCVTASREALESAGARPEELDLIVLGTLTGDCPFPATACVIQRKIGAVNAAAFDLSAACAGFVYGLSVATQFIKTGAAKNVLVIGAEILSSRVNYTDRNTCILFGDGAGAAVLTPGNGSREILTTYLGSDGEGYELLWIPAGGSRAPLTEELVRERAHQITMKGRELFKVAVMKFIEGIRRAAELAGWDVSEIDFVVPHQVNTRIIDAVIARLGIPGEKIMQNLERYGNTSAASIPLALYDAEKEGRIKPGDKVVFVAVGGGIAWGSAALKW
jgi:3-oxoacyl-[acyl-carrier-protein] synthase-3